MVPTGHCQLGMSPNKGVLPVGVGCGQKKQPGVYTQVSSYLSWIETKTKLSKRPYKHEPDSGYSLLLSPWAILVLYFLMFLLSPWLNMHWLKTKCPSQPLKQVQGWVVGCQDSDTISCAWNNQIPIRVCSCSDIQSCLALCDPVDRSPPGSSLRGIFQARIQELAAISSSRGSSWPRDQSRVPCTSCIGRGILCATWEAPVIYL